MNMNGIIKKHRTFSTHRKRIRGDDIDTPKEIRK